MVSPEGTGTRPNRPKSGRGVLLAIAALAVAAGFAALGALSPADELAAETTTTVPATTSTTTVIEPPIDLDNFDVGQLAAGEPLELTLTATVDGAIPRAVIELGDEYYLLATDGPAWTMESHSLMAWRSSDGVAWESLGTVIEGNSVSIVAAADDGLIAAGSSPDGASLLVWRSVDAVTWEVEEVPLETDVPHVATFPTAIGSHDGITAVATVTGPDIEGLLEDALAGLDIDVDAQRWGWGIDSSEGESTLTIHGPLGIAIAEVPMGDLGLTEEEQRWIEQGYHANPETWILTSAGPGEGWSRAEIQGMYGTETIFAAPAGGLMARGWGSSGMVTAATADGRTWEVRDSVGESGPWTVHRWGERLVGPSDTSIPELMVSLDGSEWERAGLAEHFPMGISWHTYPMAAGPAGVAMAVIGSQGRSMAVDDPEPSVVTTSLGHVVSLDFLNGSIELEADGLTHIWRMWEGARARGMAYDAATESIEFSQPNTGTSFGKVTSEAVVRAEEDFYRAQYQERAHRALVFTPDGEEWVIQDLADSVAAEAEISLLAVGSDHLVAIVLPQGNWYYPTTDPSFEVWTAPLP